jgi:hypothetical protein
MNNKCNENTVYKTKDLYLSACILASGIKLLELQKESERVVFFIFSISPIKAEEIIRKHWSRELILPTHDVINAIRELRTRIHSIT